MSIRFIRWSEDLSVGVPALDQDHRRLIELLNEILHAVAAGAGRAVLAKLVGDLVEGTRGHFEREERLLREMGFPDIDHHHEEHGRLMIDIAEMIDRLTDADDDGAHHFLRHWLTDHIVTYDMSYAPYVKRHKGSGAAA